MILRPDLQSMNYMADLIRDCSKARPNTFNQISFPIFQDIETKIKNKNLGLRKKAKSRIVDRQKLSKPEQVKQESNPQGKKQTLVYNKVQREQFNYMQLYRDPKAQNESSTPAYQLQLDKLDDKDQEMTFQIYLMIKKKKTIFKVEQVRRKLRGKQGNRRMNLKECDCCGFIGKHKCKHIICQKKCQKYIRRLEKSEPYYENQEPVQMVAAADELIQRNTLQGPEIPHIKISVKQQEQMVMPQIDRFQGDIQKFQEQDIYQQPQVAQQPQLPAVRETQRISENQSNQIISQTLKNKNQANQNIKSTKKEDHLQIEKVQQSLEKGQTVQKQQQK